MEAKFQAFLSRNKLESKPFQIECFKWCSMKEQAQAQQQQAQQQAQQHQAQQHQAEKKHGGILALEMGLGKTILMLGLVKCNLKQQTLIVLPRSLLDQWEKIIIQLCGCQPLVYHGSRPKSLKMPLAQIKTYPLVLTTYGQMSLPSVKQANKGRVRSRLHEIVWNRLICDEAHHVSHQKTNEFKGAQQIKAEICWLVTGTPLQNSEKELYNLYSLFGLSNSKVYYNTGENYTDTFKEMVFFRTKSGAGLVLPPLHEHTIHVEWGSESEREFALHLHSLLTFCHVPQKTLAVQIEAESENVNALRMKYMSQAQQACVYPPMLERAIVHFERMLYEFRTSGAGTSTDEYGNLDASDLHVSQSKIDAILKTLVERKANGCGKIVFCRYYTEIDIIAERLRLADPTLRLAKFDGRVPNSKRASVLSEPVDILLAQIKMCREGLNLQAHYSEAYFPSPNFNPATEQQAIARCWRMGQQKEVHVFRYILGVGGNPPGPPFGVDAPETLPPVYERNPADPFTPVGGLGGAPPQTMDEFTTQLHIKKREMVDRMTIASQTPLLTLRKIKIKYIKK
jgi:SNF2 family DNA or RNA helicase